MYVKMSVCDSVWRQQLTKKKFDAVNRSLSLLKASNDASRSRSKLNLKEVAYSDFPVSTESDCVSEISVSVLKELHREHADLSRVFPSISFISHHSDSPSSPSTKENRPTYTDLKSQRQRIHTTRRYTEVQTDSQGKSVSRYVRELERTKKRLTEQIEKEREETGKVRTENQRLRTAAVTDRERIAELTAELEALRRVVEVAGEAGELRDKGKVKRSMSPAVLRAIRRCKAEVMCTSSTAPTAR